MGHKTDDASDLPKQLSINYSGDNMHLCYEWRNRGSIVAVIFTAFWAIVMVSIFYENFDKFTSKRQLIPFLLIFGGLTVFLIYYTFANWLNKTDIVVKNGELEVKVGPVPWPGSTKIQTSNITQFYNKKRVKGSKEKRSVSFEVHYILADKTGKKLLTGLKTHSQAAFIEQKIEQYLGIEDDDSINKDDYDYMTD